MFPFGNSDPSNKKKGKQATKGETQIVRENHETINFYKTILSIGNGCFLGVHLIFYFITGLSTYSLIFFAVTSTICWYVWAKMKQIGTSRSGGAVTDLNLEGGVSEHAKDLILAIVITQTASLIHRYFWFLLLLIPAYAIYKAVKFYFNSPLAQMRAAANNNDEENKKAGKTKTVRVARH